MIGALPVGVLRKARSWNASTTSLNTAFNPRSNSIAFLRLVLALSVLFSHTFPLGGFSNGDDPLDLISGRQFNFGTVAVDGFFVLSGYLIARSFVSSSRLADYFWRRVLRIFPGYWVCLIVTALVVAPLAWHRQVGGYLGVFRVQSDSPMQYVLNNWTLIIGQWDIAGLFARTPANTLRRLAMMDGALWTLKYEFLCYIGLGALGMLALLFRRRLLVLVLVGALAVLYVAFVFFPVPTMNVLVLADPRLVDGQLYRLVYMFALGVLLFVFGDRIPLSNGLAILAATAIVILVVSGAGFAVFGQTAAAYLFLWLAIRLPITRADARGDFSYGIYIYAWPVEELSADYGLNRWGYLPYAFSVVVITLALAVLSWHLVERPALSLKRMSRHYFWRLVMPRQSRKLQLGEATALLTKLD